MCSYVFITDEKVGNYSMNLFCSCNYIYSSVFQWCFSVYAVGNVVVDIQLMLL